jgi:hypothetical protein
MVGMTHHSTIDMNRVNELSAGGGGGGEREVQHDILFTRTFNQ